MYKSTWVLRKARDLLAVEGEGGKEKVGFGMSPLDLGFAAVEEQGVWK